MKKQKIKLEALEVKSFTTSENEKEVKGGTVASLTSCGLGGLCTLVHACATGGPIGTGGGLTYCSDSNNGVYCY